VDKFAASSERPKAKNVSASGGGLRSPDPPDQGLCPGPRWGFRPQTPVIGSRTALAMGPCPQKFQARTATAYTQAHYSITDWNIANTAYYIRCTNYTKDNHMEQK